MQLEVGMYVRYKNFVNISNIAKITKIEISDNDCYENYYHFDNEDGTLEGFIIKTSHNPINLIEVGDYVNGLEVVAISKFKDGSRYIEFDEGRFICKNYQIESIVTKEQFESMSYKIGEK